MRGGAVLPPQRSARLTLVAAATPIFSCKRKSFSAEVVCSASLILPLISLAIFIYVTSGRTSSSLCRRYHQRRQR